MLQWLNWARTKVHCKMEFKLQGRKDYCCVKIEPKNVMNRWYEGTSLSTYYYYNSKGQSFLII